MMCKAKCGFDVLWSEERLLLTKHKCIFLSSVCSFHQRWQIWTAGTKDVARYEIFNYLSCWQYSSCWETAGSGSSLPQAWRETLENFSNFPFWEHTETLQYCKIISREDIVRWQNALLMPNMSWLIIWRLYQAHNTLIVNKGNVAWFTEEVTGWRDNDWLQIPTGCYEGTAPTERDNIVTILMTPTVRETRRHHHRSTLLSQ